MKDNLISAEKLLGNVSSFLYRNQDQSLNSSNLSMIVWDMVRENKRRTGISK